MAPTFLDAPKVPNKSPWFQGLQLTRPTVAGQLLGRVTGSQHLHQRQRRWLAIPKRCFSHLKNSPFLPTSSRLCSDGNGIKGTCRHETYLPAAGFKKPSNPAATRQTKKNLHHSTPAQPCQFPTSRPFSAGTSVNSGTSGSHQF